MGEGTKIVRTDSELEAALQAAEIERDKLANALGFEQAKNQVLLEQVITLEDEVVNRCMLDYEGVLSNETREFWREQMLTNREAASAALEELVKPVGSEQLAVGSGARPAGSGQLAVGSPGSTTPATGGGRRPLHNRALSRPVGPVAVGGGGPQGGEAEDRAVKIRNRAQELCSAERIPFSMAFRRAERELVQ